MKEYITPTMRIVCADVAISATLWDQITFKNLEDATLEDFSNDSDMEIIIPTNPEGDY